MDIFLAAVLIGGGATVVMDVWALFMKSAFGIPSLDYRMVGRWIGHLPRGRVMHSPIGASPAIGGEKTLGWTAHYAIGVGFAWMLLLIVGLDWAQEPTVLPALVTGLVTLVAPFFILQPGMGAGIAAAKTPAPRTARLRSLMAHLSFGIGLYLAALALSFLETL
ncbi:DUF2938 domain-containing protein [Pyruvatibacter sp.]|uniref:DUF2938 domain-containing protein n=1 Tax=Pyruvatibacter sp. TaxID=1981328 RepID=UPI00326331F7